MLVFRLFCEWGGYFRLPHSKYNARGDISPLPAIFLLVFRLFCAWGGGGYFMIGPFLHVLHEGNFNLLKIIKYIFYLAKL